MPTTAPATTTPATTTPTARTPTSARTKAAADQTPAPSTAVPDAAVQGAAVLGAAVPGAADTQHDQPSAVFGQVAGRRGEADVSATEAGEADTAVGVPGQADVTATEAGEADTVVAVPGQADVAVGVPADQDGIDLLRGEIDFIDSELVRLIQRRTALSHAIGAARRTLGGTRIVYSREMAVLERFRALGPSGTDLGMMLLAMGRGQLGRRGD